MARLTAKKRDNLSSKSFAIPGKKAYPIQDVGHARAALARVEANGTPAEKKEVREAVAKKYPNMDVKGLKKKAKGKGKS